MSEGQERLTPAEPRQVNNQRQPPPAQAVPPLAANFLQGFEGIAAAPFPPEVAAILGAPVEPNDVEIKPDGLVFLPGVAYRRILTRAFGPGGWALAPRTPARNNNGVMQYHGALYCLGRFVSEAVGECDNEYMSGPSAIESARTDCLTRCCKDLGIATELWDKRWREQWQANYCFSVWEEIKKGPKAGQKRQVWKLKEQTKAGQALPEGRNAGGKDSTPKGEAPTGELSQGSTPSAPVTVAPNTSASTVGQSTAPSTSAMTQSAATSPDTGEAATPGDRKLLNEQIGKLGWPRTTAVTWIRSTFGVDSTAGMTKQQAASGLMLLLAQQNGDAAYKVAHEKLKSEGRVL